MKKSFVITLVCLFILPLLAAGATWTTKRLTWNFGDSKNPYIAINSSDHVHIFWHDGSSVNFEIYTKKSINGGTSWSDMCLTSTSDDSLHPDAVIDSDDYIHLVWYENPIGTSDDIFYKKSTDGGNSWKAKRLTWNPHVSLHPAITVGLNKHIHVVWYDYSLGNYEIFYKTSTDSGSSWSTKRLTWNSGFSTYPDIAVDSNNHIYVVWYDSSSGNNEIFLKKSTDGGTTWTGQRLTWNPGDTRHPSIFIDSNDYIHVVFQNYYYGNDDIHYKKSMDSGATWTSKRLCWNSGSSVHPDIAVDSSNEIHVVWYDGTPGNNEIFYKTSTDGGSSWAGQRLTWNAGDSKNPTIASDSNDHIYITWYDYIGGNYEIYYKKKS